MNGLITPLAAAQFAIAVPRWGVVVTAGVVGLVIGSFLNVVVYRTPRHLSIVQPASFCPSCGTPVRSFDNVPVLSWLILRGRCRSCRAPISPRYPLVEGGTGVLFALVAAAVGPHWAVVGLCVLAATLAASAAIELDGERPPLSVASWGTGIGVLGLLGVTASDGHWAKFGSAIGGVAVAGALGVLLSRTAATAGSPSVAHGSWALLPAGAALGWSGPVGTAVGAGVLGGLLLVALRTGRSSEGAPGQRTIVVGPGAAAALSAVLGVVAAIAAGASLA
jgi:leader peptidase (prepilin peptidase)/N-methyltransferase